MSSEGIEVIVSSIRELIFLANTFPLDAFKIFATASLRNIENSQEAVSTIESHIRHRIDLLSDQEESSFGFKAVLKYETLPKEGLSIDVGGGSMEITYFKDNQLIETTSIPVGSLNFYNKFVANVIPTKTEQIDMRAYARLFFDEVEWLKGKSIQTVVGIGGTARALYKMNKSVHQDKESILSKENVADVAHLQADSAQRILEAVPDRLVTLIPGAILVDELMNYVNAQEFTSSKASLREGYLYQRVISEA
jgi:exopolyphosphatase / guanosine-5'-triphosphate,3'-diphosphate pyrophosphatase